MEKKDEILDKEIEDLIQERQEARKSKNFARADEIRDELLAKGIQLKDTREGVKSVSYTHLDVYKRQVVIHAKRM